MDQEAYLELSKDGKTLIDCKEGYNGVVIIPKGVTKIEDDAFTHCTNLTTIKIPDSVVEIGEWAFFDCTSLKEIIVDEGNPNYCSKDGILYEKDMKTLIEVPMNITSIEVPNSITEIENWFYPGHHCLTSIKIHDRVTEIEVGAFSDCSNLKEIIVDEGNPFYCSKDGILYSKDMKTLIEVPRDKVSIEIPKNVTKIEGMSFNGCSNLSSIKIPDSVTEIGYYAFNLCKKLVSIEIPNGVTKIGHNAFSGCSSIYSIKIPKSVKEIGTRAFASNTSLLEILIDEENPNYCSRDGVLYSKDMQTLIAVPGGKDMITIPDSVTNIGQSAFEGCICLTSIKIPNSVTAIPYGAFYGCTSLTSIEIPNSVTWIEERAFSGCASLISIKIPKGVPVIEWNVFSDCTSLKEIIVDEGNPDFCSKDGILYTKDMKGLIVVPSTFASIEIPDSITVIWDGAFSDCTSLTSIKIPNGVIKIGNKAFSGCTFLTSIEIPDSVTSIFQDAFFDCTSLKEIHFKHKIPKDFYFEFWRPINSKFTLFVPKGSGDIYRNNDYYKELKDCIQEE